MFTALVQCPKLLGHCPSLESFDRLKGGNWFWSILMQLWFCERFLGDSEMRGLLQVFEDGWVQFEHVKPSPRFDHSVGWTTETWALGNLVPNPVRRGSADWPPELRGFSMLYYQTWPAIYPNYALLSWGTSTRRFQHQLTSVGALALNNMKNIKYII